MNTYEVSFELCNGRSSSPATVCLSADNQAQAVETAKQTVLAQEPSTDVLEITGVRTISLKEA